MSYDKRRDRDGGGGETGGGTSWSPAPGKTTYTERLVQRKAIGDATLPSPAALGTTISWVSSPGADPFGLHLLQERAAHTVVQRKEIDRSATREAASIDAPREVEEPRGTLEVPTAEAGEAGTHQLLTHEQLTHAQHQNARLCHSWAREGKDERVFADARPDSHEFAHAVARFQASTGGELKVDGVAGPKTWAKKGFTPTHADAAVESTRGTRDSAGAAARATPGAIDADRAESIQDEGARLPVQAKADGSLATGGEHVHQIAARGVDGPGQELPFLGDLQQSFGAHGDGLKDVRAHVGGVAEQAAGHMGAQAYATGNDVALPANASKHLVAHEAAHTVQQRAGVSFAGGVGAAGDTYEQHADAVADRVVAGKSAEDLFASGPHGASSSAVQKRDAEGGLKAPSPIAVHDTSEGAIPALTAVATAATEAENDLERVKAGHLDANAACLQVAVKVGRAVQALRLLSHNEARWFSSGPDPAMHEQIKEQIDRLYAPCMHLARVAEATAAYSKTPNVGEPTLLALVTEMAELGLSVGWKAPTTLAEADVRAQPPEPACAPGSAEQGVPSCNLHDDTREQKRNDVRGMLATKLVVVFDACNDEKETIEKAIARDEKIKDIVTDLVVGSFVGLTFGAAGAAAGAATEASALEGAGAKAAQTAVTAGGHTEARMLAQATQQLAKPSAVGEVVKAGAHEVAEGAGGLTREVAKEQVKGVVENVLKAGIGSLESADTRERTLRMIEGLKNSATRATDAAFSKIVLLNDDDLQSVYFNLKNADFSGAVHELIGRYREQVEPIGDGYSSGGNMVVGQAARIVAPDGRRRLALVEMTEDASIVGMGTRAVVAGTSMAFGIATPEGEKVRPTADQAKQFILDPTVSISFVRWIDDDMAPAAEATGAIDIPLARIFGNQDEAASGF